MKEENNAVNLPKLPLPAEHRMNLPQVMSYPAKEDIYNKSKEEQNIYPENISTTKDSNNKKNISSDVSGNDLDVPGSELDDADEKIGSEDEENNYYSIGGDDHSNLDESKDE